MKKRSLLVLTAVALGVAFLVAGVYATQPVPETITMDSKVFLKHKKALVTFSHKKHHVDYKIACTECHHVYKDCKNVWKEGDDVQKCDTCHTEAEAPKGEQLAKKELVKRYYYSAIHENCKSCHKALKKAGKPAGPTACQGCHPKKK